MARKNNYKLDGANRRKLMDRISNATDQATSGRMALEQSWFLNHINYLGFQWHLFSPLSSTLNHVTEAVRYRANFLQPLVHHRVAKLTSSPPDWDVDTPHSSRLSADFAEICEEFLEYIWDKEHMSAQSKRLATMSSIYGTCIAHAYWDPNAGEPITPEDFFRPNHLGMQMGDDELLEAFDGDVKAAERFLDGEEELYSGDICIDLVTPFEFFIDPHACEVKDARWAMMVRKRPIDTVLERFPEFEDLEPDSHNDKLSMKYADWLHSFVSPNVGAVGGTLDQGPQDDVVYLYEYWERPCRDYPGGIYAVYANKRILHFGPNEYAGTAAELPFVKFIDVDVPGRFWGCAALEQAISVQRDYNKARSDMIKASHDHANPKILLPNTCGVSPGAFNRDSNEVVRYNPAGFGGVIAEPKRMEGGNVSNMHTSRLELSMQEMREIMGVHEVSSGQLPSGDVAGITVRLLQEADSTRIGSVLQLFQRSYEQLGELVLSLGKRFITESRYFESISGESEKGKIIEFTGEDLNFRRVRIRMGSMQGRQRAAEQQAILSLLQYGGPEMFDTPKLREALLMAAGVKTANAGLIDSVDENRAIYNITLIKRGIYPEVNDYDDHTIHIRLVESEMKDPAFDGLPPEVKNGLRQYRLEHLAMKQEAEAQQLAQMQAMQAAQQGGSQNVGVGIGLSSEDLANDQALPDLGED